MAITRDDLYKAFGPIFMEAIVRLIFSEINILRNRAGLEPRTVQQGLDALDAQLAKLERYNWMDDEENG